MKLIIAAVLALAATAAMAEDPWALKPIEPAPTEVSISPEASLWAAAEAEALRTAKAAEVAEALAEWAKLPDAQQRALMPLLAEDLREETNAALPIASANAAKAAEAEAKLWRDAADAAKARLPATN